MKTGRGLPISILILIFIGFMGSSGMGQNLVGQPTRGLFGLKVGLISRMDLTDGWYLQSEIGSCAQIYADFPQGKDYFLTTAFDFYYIEINRSNQIMIEGSLGLKHAFVLERQRMVIKPGLTIGFAYLAEMGDLPASQFLTLKLPIETHFKIDAKKAWVGELALFYAPKGSNGDTDLVFGPGVMLRWGLAFR